MVASRDERKEIRDERMDQMDGFGAFIVKIRGT